VAFVLGLDGYPRGWVCVAIRDGAVEGALAAATLDAAIRAFPPAAAIGVDMPFAMEGRGPRRADGAARSFVGPRASSVFPVPPLASLDAVTHAEAVVLARANGGPAPSAQCFALFPKIREAASLAATGAPLFEVHPEVSFRALARDPLPSKRTWNGLRARLTALDAAGIRVPDVTGDEPPADDVLDAAVVAWTAARIAAGSARTLPADPTPEERAANMLVWY
jgi:predicted RNase H-like nuclease